MQVIYFDGGSFVIHQIAGNFKGRCSAWFDKDGVPYSSQQFVNFEMGFYNCHTGRRIKIGGPIWRHLQKVGKRFVGLNK